MGTPRRNDYVPPHSAKPRNRIPNYVQHCQSPARSTRLLPPVQYGFRQSDDPRHVRTIPPRAKMGVGRESSEYGLIGKEILIPSKAHGSARLLTRHLQFPYAAKPCSTVGRLADVWLVRRRALASRQPRRQCHRSVIYHHPRFRDTRRPRERELAQDVGCVQRTNRKVFWCVARTPRFLYSRNPSDLTWLTPTHPCPILIG
jgi:hypothetical protein